MFDIAKALLMHAICAHVTLDSLIYAFNRAEKPMVVTEARNGSGSSTSQPSMGENNTT